MKNTLNFILFHLLWLSCIFGAAHQVLLPSAIILTVMLYLYLKTTLSHSTDFIYVIYAIILGFLLDSLLASTGLIHYHFNFGVSFLAPLWILFLWAGFALTFNHSMAWMFNNKKMAYVLIGLGSPMSYFSAYKLNAIDIDNVPLALVVASILWLTAFRLITSIQGSNINKEVCHHI